MQFKKLKKKKEKGTAQERNKMLTGPSKCGHTDRMALESGFVLSLHCLKAAGDQNDDGIILAEGKNLD